MTGGGVTSGLFDQFDASMAQRQRLMDKATHKALNIPYEGDGVRVNTHIVKGMGWKEMAIIGGLLLGMGGLGLGFAAISQREEPSPPPPSAQAQPATVTPPPVVPPIHAEYEILFFDAKGKPIHVEQLPDEGIGSRTNPT